MAGTAASSQAPFPITQISSLAHGFGTVVYVKPNQARGSQWCDSRITGPANTGPRPSGDNAKVAIRIEGISSSANIYSKWIGFGPPGGNSSTDHQ